MALHQVFECHVVGHFNICPVMVMKRVYPSIVIVSVLTKCVTPVISLAFITHCICITITTNYNNSKWYIVIKVIVS